MFIGYTKAWVRPDQADKFNEFLKKNPDINFHAFNKNDISSVTNDFDFAGVSYDDALEKLVEDMDPGYQEYLRVERNIKVLQIIQI